MKAGAHLQQRAHPPVNVGIAFSRLGDAGENLEPCTEPVEVSVVLPAPLRPMLVLSTVEGMPTTSPRFTSNETSFKAQMVSSISAAP